MDVIADPDMVNKLLLIFFDEEPMTACTDAPSPKVCILEAFYETNHKPRNSALSLELTDMLKDKMILYHFMEFMKNEGSLNVLQFCLSVEDFNRRSLVPELSIDQMVCLHQEAQDLYRLYFAPHAIDRIQFEDDIIGEVKSIAEGPYKEVTRLRTSDALFRAYEHAYNLLENTFCPLFHQSDAYYTMLCGRRLSYDCRPLSPVSDLSPTTPSPPPSPPPPPPSAAQLQQRRRSNEPLSAVSKLGSRIKGVFKSQTVEERLLMEAEDMLESDSPQSVTDILGVEDILPLSFPLRDLSAWRVNILRCGLRQEGNNKYFVYVIHVDRLDVRTAGEEKMSWEVERRYHEFYVLENKLTEFHGVFEDCSLPSKRSFGTRTQDFIESKLPILEKWLQMLLTKPVLRGSELLYNFLTTKDEFVAKLLPDVNFGKMLKSVPNRLLKERGQFLEPFLQSFAASTEAPKPKPSGNDLRDKTYETLLEKRHSDIYDDNAEFNVDDDDEIQYTREITDVNVLDLDGAFEYVVYLARAAYEIPVWIHQILMTVKILAKNTIEGYLD
ncbi:sorting nexin-14-like [Saccoglossus kowalevskii]